MEFALSPELEALRARARRYVVEELQPLETEFERARGQMPPEQARELRRKAIKAGLVGGNLPKHLGGLGWTNMEQVVVQEQFGQVTGGLWSYAR